MPLHETPVLQHHSTPAHLDSGCHPTKQCAVRLLGEHRPATGGSSCGSSCGSLVLLLLVALLVAPLALACLAALEGPVALLLIYSRTDIQHMTQHVVTHATRCMNGLSQPVVPRRTPGPFPDPSKRRPLLSFISLLLGMMCWFRMCTHRQARHPPCARSSLPSAVASRRPCRWPRQPLPLPASPPPRHPALTCHHHQSASTGNIGAHTVRCPNTC